MKNLQFEKDILVVSKIFTKLKITEDKGEQFLTGSLDIIDGSGELWDTYNIEIRGSKEYPFRFPKLFETNNAFPKNADWHVYESDFSCCIDVPMSERLLCKNGLNVTDYIRQYAIPYFANQSFRRREGYYLYGEYAHGIEGRLQYYQSKLEAKNLKELIQMFGLIIKDYNPPRTAFCPFCKKKKFRHCHRDVFRDLNTVKEFLIYDLEKLKKILILFPNYQLPSLN